MRPVARHLIIFGASVFGIGAQAQTTKDEIAAINRHFEKYEALMNAVDTDAISTEVYATPVFFAAQDGKHSVIASPDQLSKSWHNLLAYRENRPRLPKGTHEVKSVCFLRPDVAMASVHFNFPRPDGSKGTSDWFYLLQKSKAEWRTTLLAEEQEGVNISCGSQ